MKPPQERMIFAAAGPGGHRFSPRRDDPLDATSQEDRVPDAPVATTRRGLARLAKAAAETGARFERDGAVEGATRWLLASRALLDGRAAIDACLSADGCARVVLLHGLDLPLDAGRPELEAIVVGQGARPMSGSSRGGGAGSGTPARSRQKRSKRRLFTSTLVAATEDGTLCVFDAAVAESAAEVRARLGRRHGVHIAGHAEIIEGFDPHARLAIALVSRGVARLLRQIARDPGSRLADGLELTIEQRFAA